MINKINYYTYLQIFFGQKKPACSFLKLEKIIVGSEKYVKKDEA